MIGDRTAPYHMERDGYAYLVYKGKWSTTGWGARKPPTKAAQ